ncbi:MAG: hypothetical protein OXH96_25920 [Spirochaetaceae bacterium]|nr:hypothetical protein [Spirochaetaceae bacterium]
MTSEVPVMDRVRVMDRLRRRAPAILLMVLAATGLAAQAPLREEQFVYSIVAFSGRDYAGTFARREADTIYLMADVDNFITARNALVYFWPITGEWKLDLAGLDVPFEGTLELNGRGREPERIGMTPYTYYNVRGEYELNWEVAIEEEAEAVVQHSRELIAAYYAAVQTHQRERALYEELLNELATVITALRREGRDVTELVAELEKLEAPAPPEPPDHYVVPPSTVQQAFILNLPVGEYDIRFLTAGGEVMEGSERRIVTFARRRAEAVGMEVIPGDKWTRPVESTSPSAVLYVDGSTDLYLRPFYQQEYNDLFYEKLRRNDARGNPGLMKWVRIQQVPGASLSVSAGGARSQAADPRMVQEAPFFVEQIPGGALGYRIVPFDPDGAHLGREPSLRAFRLPVSARQPVLHLRVLDRAGDVLPSSDRQVRIVAPPANGWLTLLPAAIPLLILVVALALRSRRVSR